LHGEEAVSIRHIETLDSRLDMEVVTGQLCRQIVGRAMEKRIQGIRLYMAYIDLPEP